MHHNQVSDPTGVRSIHWSMSAGAEREAEAAPKKGEEAGARGAAKGVSPTSVLKEHWPTALRIAELVLIVICVGLIVDPLNYGRLPTLNLHRIAVIYSAFSGYIIITGVLVFGRLMGEHLGWRMSIAFSLIGTAVFVAAGGVIIADWTKYTYTHTFHPSKQYLDMMCSSGVFSIFAAAVFLLDAVLTFKQEANI